MGNRAELYVYAWITEWREGRPIGALGLGTSRERRCLLAMFLIPVLHHPNDSIEA